MARAIDADIIIKDLTAMKKMYDAIELDGMIKALKEAPTIEPKQEWISVKDRLPEPDVKTIGRIETEKVIAWDGNRLVFGNFTIYRHDNSFEFYGADADGTHCFWKVTHWMPLPEPPEKDGE